MLLESLFAVLTDLTISESYTAYDECNWRREWSPPTMCDLAKEMMHA